MTTSPRPGTGAGAAYALGEKQAAAQREARRAHYTPARPISTIADEIMRKWPNPFYGAVPYINAMFALTTITDKYDQEQGRHIVLYFLSNAKTWRGDDARRIKAELKAML